MLKCWLGVDGTRSGWVVFVLIDNDEYELWHIDKLDDLEIFINRFAIQSIALDIPFGLLDEAQRGGRGCDREARKLLSLAKRNAFITKKTLPLVGSSSIFTPPSRRALAAFSKGATHAETSEANRQSAKEDLESSPKEDIGVGLGLSIQTYHILPKICEADAFVTPSNKESGQSLSVKVATLECHPELAFLSLSKKNSEGDDGPRLELHEVKALWSKKLLEGRQQRVELICTEGGLDVTKLLKLARAEGDLNISKTTKANEVLLSQQRTWRLQSLADKDRKKISVAADDVLDAIICAITSQKWSLGHSKVIEEEDQGRQIDKHGLPMVIWA